MRDKRQHQRAQFTVPATLVWEGGDLLAESVDISLGGTSIGVSGAAELPELGASVHLALELPTLGPVKLPAFVRWVRGEAVGLQFGLIGARETHVIGRIVRGSLPDID